LLLGIVVSYCVTIIGVPWTNDYISLEGRMRRSFAVIKRLQLKPLAVCVIGSLLLSCIVSHMMCIWLCSIELPCGLHRNISMLLGQQVVNDVYICSEGFATM